MTVKTMWALVLALAVAVVLGASPVAAQAPGVEPYTGATPPPTSTPSQVGTLEVLGEDQVRGCGFLPGSTVTVTVDGRVIGTATADASGCVGAQVTGLTPGAHQVVLSGPGAAGGTLRLEGTLTVGGIGAVAAPAAGPAGAAPGGPLPTTGRSIAGWVVAGIVLIAAGSLAVAAAAARRRSDARV